MHADFWHERWQQGQIGFHQPAPHPGLDRHWASLGLAPAARVLVPLCGRSLDMAWLARQGHAVLGVELSPIATADFFDHESLAASKSEAGPFLRFAAGPYEILQGDVFELTPALAGDLGGWYDRAALVALPADMRRRYAGLLGGLLASGTRGLLITHDYPAGQMDGPPFSVPVAEVDELFAPAFDIELLERRDVLADNPRFVERGLGSFHEALFTLVRR